MPTPLTLLAQGTLADVNIGAKAAVLAILPLIAQLDLQLGAEFGLGQLKAEIQARLKAALEGAVQITAPSASLLVALQGALQSVVALQAALNAGGVLTPPGISASGSLQVIADLQARLTGLQLLLDLAAGVRLQGANLVGALNAALSVGPVALYGATGQLLPELLSQINGADYASVGINNTDTCDALLLLSKAPGFNAAAGLLFVVPPA